MYVKLFSDILTSTIWMEEDHVVRVWLTFLLLANSEGFFEMPIPAIAQQARVSLQEAVDAVKRLESPDPFSRTKEEDGRRIIRITEEKTLWHIVNYENYRAMRSKEQKAKYQREYMREYRERKRNRPACKENPETGLTCESKPYGLAHAEEEGEEERSTPKKESYVNANDVDLAEPPQEDHKQSKKEGRDYCKLVKARWNTIVAETGLPQIQRIGPKRNAAVLARRKEFGEEAVFDVISKIAVSSFLRGETGRDSWVGATFDWIFKPSNFLKTLEGNYDDKPRIPQQDLAAGASSPGAQWHQEDVIRYGQPGLEHERWGEYFEACMADPACAYSPWPRFDEWLEGSDGQAEQA